jgi:hypothetical protein
MHPTADSSAYATEPQSILPEDDAVVHKYPLSLNQQSVWFECHLNPHSALYNLGLAAAISGPLDGQTFRRAMQAVTSRHQILRTVLRVADDVPFQCVLASKRVCCPVHELGPDLAPAQRKQIVISRMQELAAQPYDLARGPLLRAELLRVGEDSHYLLLGFHHLVLDAFYAGQFLREVLSDHESLRHGQAPGEPPAVQYGEFSAQQQQRRDGGLMTPTISFWQAELHEPLPRVSFPERQNVALPAPIHASISFDKRGQQLHALRAIADSSRTTLFRVVVAILAAFLSNLGQCSEITMDVDFSTRPRGMGRTIGFFANPLLLRVIVHQQDRLLDLVGAVDRQLRAIGQNREFPVRKLARRIKRDASQALSSVLVTQVDQLKCAAGELRMTGGLYIAATTHDLWMLVADRGDELRIGFLHPKGAFSEETMVYQVQRFSEWIDIAAASPEGFIASLIPMLSVTALNNAGLGNLRIEPLPDVTGCEDWNPELENRI